MHEVDELRQQLARERSARQAAEAALREQEGALHRAREELERRVSERTAELTRLNGLLQRRTRDISVINGFALSLLAQSTVDEIVWDIARSAVARLGLEDCVVYLLDERRNALVQRAAHGPKSPERHVIIDPIVIPVGQGVVGSVALTGEPDLVVDTRKDGRYIVDDAVRLSELAVPILHEDKVIGVIDSEHPEAGFYTEEHLQIFTTIAAMASTRIADALTTQELKETIDDLRRTEQELERARAAAEQASRHKSEFLANMSHEIRTPLNAVLGFGSLLLQTHLDDEQRDWLETMRTSGETLLAIINDILDFSKIEAGRLELEQRPFVLRDCVKRSVDLLAPQAARKGLSLHATVDEKVPARVVGDVTRVHQVLGNLLSNAVKFTGQGEVALSLRSEVEVSGEDGSAIHALHFAVTDTGIGIPEDRRARLFQPFSQVDASTTRQYGGTGLGLAICRRLTEMMGGGIEVESTPGQGSTFRFTLRMPAAPDQPEQAPGPEVPLDASLARARPLRILVAEDNLVNQKVALRMLERLGYTADLAENGLAVLELLEHKVYDVVLMDVQMPVLDGVEAARRIRARSDRPQPWIVAFTANALAGDRERFLGAGMDAYVTKPIALERLAAALAEVPARSVGVD